MPAARCVARIVKAAGLAALAVAVSVATTSAHPADAHASFKVTRTTGGWPQTAQYSAGTLTVEGLGEEGVNTTRVADLDLDRATLEEQTYVGYFFIRLTCRRGLNCVSGRGAWAGNYRETIVECNTRRECESFLNVLKTAMASAPSPKEPAIDGSKIPPTIDFPCPAAPVPPTNGDGIITDPTLNPFDQMSKKLQEIRCRQGLGKR